MIPFDSSRYEFPFSHSMSENIDSIAQMLMGNSLSYEKEGCRFLVEKIRKKVSGNFRIEETLEKLSEMIEHPDHFDPVSIQQTLGALSSLD